MGRGEHKQTTALIDAALKILGEQNPMTIRQLFYRLVSVNVIPNDLPSYHRVSDVMTTARNDERCPWDWIADRSRPVYEAGGFVDATYYADVIRGGYSKKHWVTQPEHVEILVEKDAIIGSIQDLCKELGVTIRVGRGYWSTTAVHAIAEDFDLIGKPITVFYLGDHDPSGIDIPRDLEDRISQYSEGADFEVERLAIHKEDIALFNLPPLPLKKKKDGTDSDPRAKGFRLEHGTQAVELDALPPVELRRRISEAVKKHIDTDLWEESLRIEIVEKGRIADAVNQWSSMTDADAPTWAEFQSLQQDHPLILSAIRNPEAISKMAEACGERTPSEFLIQGLQAVQELLAATLK